MRINLSDIVNSEEFQEDITLINNITSINEYGETIISSTSSTIKAVVTNVNDKFSLKPEYQQYANFIEVTSLTNLKSLRKNNQPDYISYHGDMYKILTAEDDSSFGFYSAIAGLVEVIPN